MEKKLGEKYGEYSIFRGIQKGNRTLTDIFVNVETGSYTEITVTPKKHGLVACITGSGTGGVVGDPVKPHTVSLNN